MSNTLGTERGTSQLRVTQVNQGVFPPEEGPPTLGVVVIAVVICIVGTSIIWVIIIYHTRKGGSRGGADGEMPPTAPSSEIMAPYTSCSAAACTTATSRRPQGMGSVFLDSQSGHSKDSGTGDSGQQSSDELLVEDDHDLLIEARPSSKFGAIPIMCDPETSLPSSFRTGSGCKEQVPLLQTFRTSRLADPPPKWRSFSAEQLDPALCHCGPREKFLRTSSDATTERDSGFSTLPRSVTLASVSNWSNGDSPRFLRLPKDIPNDSGSFSMAGDEAHELANRCRSISALPTHNSSKSCTCTVNTS